MGFFAVVGNVAKSCVDVKSWISYDTVVSGGKAFSNSFKALSTPRKATFQETFEEAVKRLDLSEEALQVIAKRFLYQSYFFLLTAAVTAVYMLHLLWKGALFPGFISLLILMLFLTRAFETHFYHFQIEHRKLGCTIKEWFQGCIKEEKA